MSTNTHGAQGRAERPASADTAVAPVAPELPQVCRQWARISAVVAAAAVTCLVISLARIIATSEPDPYDERPTSPLVYVMIAAFLVAFIALAVAIQSRKIAAVLDDAEWRTSMHTELNVGRGKARMTLVHLQATNRWYRPSCPILASISLQEDELVEWAGDPAGKIVVRRPGRSWLTLYKIDPRR